MKVKSVNPSSHGRYNKYKKKVWIKVDNTDDVEIELEVYDVEILDCLFVLYDKKGNIVIKEANTNQQLNLLV